MQLKKEKERGFRTPKDFEDDDEYALYTIAMFICGTNELITEDTALKCVKASLAEDGLFSPEETFRAGQMAVRYTADEHAMKGKLN